MDPRDREQQPGSDPARGQVPGRAAGRTPGPLGPPGRRARRRSGEGGPVTSRQRADGPTRTRPLEESGEVDPTESVADAAAGPDAADREPKDQHAANRGSAPPRQRTGDNPTGTSDTTRAPGPLPHVRVLDGITGAGRVLKAGGLGAGRVTSRGVAAVVHSVRRVTHAQGMGESGLAKLIELNAFHAGGDAAMAIGLAGTLFFAVPSGEARGRVALYLLITMAPFVVVAPLIGPFIDRFRSGRRWAIGSTMAIRAFFCWVMAGAVTTGELYLYPLVFGCLIASKAHNVTRAAAVPRLLPRDVALVTANSRISLAGSVAAGIAAAAAGGAAYFGPAWSLRVAFVIFTLGTLLAILLPPRVDSSAGEDRLRMVDIRRTLRRLPPVVGVALRANTAFRAFTGFLLMFMAFLLRDLPLSGYSTTVQVALVVGAAGAGNLVGTALGALARARRSEVVIRALLGGSAVAAALTAILYGLPTLALLAFVAGFAQQLGKLCLDALIQSEVPEHVRTSVFARSETLLQLSWVIGGGVGIVLPLIPQLGLGLCAFGLVVGLVIVLRSMPGTAERPPDTGAELHTHPADPHAARD